MKLNLSESIKKTPSNNSLLKPILEILEDKSSYKWKLVNSLFERFFNWKPILLAQEVQLKTIISKNNLIDSFRWLVFSGEHIMDWGNALFADFLLELIEEENEKVDNIVKWQVASLLWDQKNVDSGFRDPRDMLDCVDQLGKIAACESQQKGYY